VANQPIAAATTTALNVARRITQLTHYFISVMDLFGNGGFQAIEDRWIGYANKQCFQSPNGANG